MKERRKGKEKISVSKADKKGKEEEGEEEGEE